LVETVLAVGVVAFAFVAILGLIPAGLTQFRQAIDTSVCAQISQRVIMDAQQTDFDTLVDMDSLASSSATHPDNFTFRAPGAGAEEFRYFDEQGNEIVPSVAAKRNPSALTKEEKAQVVYHVITRIGANTHVPRTGNSGKGGVLNTIATVTVQIAYNPGNLTLPISNDNATDRDKPDRNLFDRAAIGKTMPGVMLKTYSAQVGQNQ
jgi:uncharacterized protein (TIGR02598 family)